MYVNIKFINHLYLQDYTTNRRRFSAIDTERCESAKTRAGDKSQARARATENKTTAKFGTANKNKAIQCEKNQAKLKCHVRNTY